MAEEGDVAGNECGGAVGYRDIQIVEGEAGGGEHLARQEDIAKR